MLHFDLETAVSINPNKVEEKMKKICFLVFVFSLLPTQAWAAADTGVIVEVYAHPNGWMALRLDNGLPNANAQNNCGTTGNEWAGVEVSADPSIKSAILMAKAAGSTVTLVTLGNCAGGWIKIEAMHIK